ncbi:MAG: transposase [Bacteroidota bacterium]
MVNAIIYKLKTGTQWQLLPVNSLISSAQISYSTVYHHYRKWCKDGSWQDVWTQFLSRFKSLLDLSTAQLDRTHSLAKKGGEAVGYQGRKKAKTSNILCISDKNGLVVAWSKPVSGNHNDLFQIENQVKTMLGQLKESAISVEGLFINADAGFDAEVLRKILDKEGVILNVAHNKRNGSRWDSDVFFDEKIYQERFVVERTNAWMDSFRSLILRQDTTIDSWWAWHFIAATVWMIKHKIKTQKKTLNDFIVYLPE